MTNIKNIFILTAFILLPSIASAATLSVLPASQNVNVGDTFSVIVNLDTKNALVDGVDLRYLNYNPALLQVQNATTSTTMVQISPGNLMSATLANSVDTNLGRITFSQIAVGGTQYNGSGTLATITFKALAAGNASLTFDYIANSTTNSDVASAGSNILSGVNNGSYTINNPSPPAPVIPPGGGSGGGCAYQYNINLGRCNYAPVITPTGTNISIITNSAPTITRWLTVGSSGSDVLQLQKALNQNGYVIATTGLGSPNNESTYFGTTTAAAVGRFQCAKLQVCQGTPETTGYGATGPRTRQALSLLTILSYTSASQIPTSTSTINIPIFNRSLTLGSTGLDVKNLQILLNTKGFIVSVAGAGSKGLETTYFGLATQRAVIKFQEYYKSEVLTPSGLVKGTGYFGPATLKRVNQFLITGK